MRRFNQLCTHQPISPSAPSHRSTRWLAAVIASCCIAPAVAQTPACDGCKDRVHSHAHPASMHSAASNTGVYLPSLQSILVDKMNRAGDRIESRLHRHSGRTASFQHSPCDRPDCTQCTGSQSVTAMPPTQRAPFANSSAPTNSLPRIVRPAARGKLSDTLPTSTDNVLDARRLVPALAPPTESPRSDDRTNVPAVNPPSENSQPPASEPTPAADLLDIAKRSEPAIDRSSTERNASTPSSAGAFVQRQPRASAASDTLPGTATLESIGTRTQDVPPPAKLPSSTRAFPESVPSESGQSSPSDSEQNAPDILVDPFRDDPRPNPSSEFGRNPNPTVLPPKPLANPSAFGSAKPSVSSGTLRAKFESAKRASTTARTASNGAEPTKR